MCCIIGNNCLTAYLGKMSFVLCMLEQAISVIICVILLLWLSPVFISVLQLMFLAYKSSDWFLCSTIVVDDQSGFNNVLLFAGVVSTTSHQLWCQVVTSPRFSVQCA